MKQIKKFNQDILYKIELRVYDGCAEYLLVDANDSDEVYCILEEDDLKEDIK